MCTPVTNRKKVESMRILLFSFLVYLTTFTILFKGFKQNFFGVHYLLIFTFLFWFFIVLQYFGNATQDLANFLGFEMASNLIYACSIALLFIAFVRLKMEVVRIHRAMRRLIVQQEIVNIRNDLEKK